MCSNNKTLKIKDFRGLHNSIKELTEKCIVNDNGHFLTLGEIKEWLKWNISIYDYNIIRSSFPAQWQRKMSNKVHSMNLYRNITVIIRGQLISLTQMKNKDIHWELIGNEEIQASVINTWILCFKYAPWRRYPNIFTL